MTLNNQSGPRAGCVPAMPFQDLSPEMQFRMLDLAGDVHVAAAILLAGLIPLHVIAALKHHFLDRDDVLEGMLPEEAGDRTQDNDLFRQSLISSVDPDAAAGLTVEQDFFTGPSAEAAEIEGACFEG